MFEEHGLEHKPGQIYNYSESGILMPFDTQPLNVIT